MDECFKQTIPLSSYKEEEERGKYIQLPTDPPSSLKQHENRLNQIESEG